MIDYEEIIRGLEDKKVIQLMESLGSGYKEEPDCIIFQTICHNGDADDASYKLYYYKNTHLFYCYSEDGAMSIFSFLKHYYETRGIEYNWYNDIYKKIVDCNSSYYGEDFGFEKEKHEDLHLKYDRKIKLEELPAYPEGVLDTFIKEYPVEWLNDGISKEAMDRFNIRYSISQNKIIIPHYDVKGRLVGIRGRALDEWEAENIGKYMPVKIEQTWYKHRLSFNLYGLKENKENIKEKGYVYIFESEKSVLQCESFSDLNCAVAVCGSSLNINQVRLLMRECAPKEFIICFDNEEKKGESKYFKKLYEMCSKYKNYANFSFIYDREGLSKLKDSPSDNGEEIFNKLRRSRVIVK